MDSANIENLDRRRYKLLLWGTVCLVLLGLVLLSLLFTDGDYLMVPTSVMILLVAVLGGN